ncbi:MAG TPA: protein kinase [Gemmatimonadales bacterium]|nr:protein kinase [Gemmatimonadales bacterium]
MSDCAKCHTPLPVDGRFCSNCGTPSGEMAHVCPTDPTEELRQRLARTLTGRYEITRLLGRGGMAVVFLAEDLALERQVAIKVLPPDMSHDTKLIPRFQQEAKTAAKLDHPNIIPIYRVESEAGLDYFVMKYVNGRSLEQVLEDGPLPIDLARRVLREAALALGHAHQRRIVHRDVKPANIMIDADGRVILTDFGISKAVQGASQLTGTGTIIGTPHYMAPEQAKGLEVDGRADQYALAIVGHQILTGKQPFDGSAHSILYKHVFEPPPPVLATRPDVPREISTALERALSKEAEQRFPTMEDFAAALSVERPGARTVVSAPIRPLATSGPKAAKSTPRGNLARRSIVILGICAVAGGAAWAGLREPVAPPEPLPAVAPAPTPEAVAPPVEPVLPTPAAAQPERQEPQPVAPTAQGEAAIQAPARLKPAKKENAYLTVASEPWGTLYLDNVEIGPTPVADYPLPPGRHQLRIEQEGYRTKIETIVVTGPNPIRRRYSLEPAGP